MTQTQPLPFSLRSATLSDAHAIAEVQVAVWQSAYRDILPAALIERMSVADRENGWEKILTAYAESGRGAVFVAEQVGAVVGFLSCGDQRDEELLTFFPGEFSAIYVADSVQRQGIGRALMGEGARALTAMGHGAAALWVLSENAGARGFYQAIGGVVSAERIDGQNGEGLDEIAYGWADLSEICAI